MDSMIYKLYETNDLKKEEILFMLKNMNSEYKSILFRLAAAMRKKHYGDAVFIRGLIEFSSFCKNACKYCGLRKNNTALKRYRMTKEQIIACCKMGYGLGIRTFVLQSGEDAFFSDDILIDIIERIKTQFPDTAVTLSIGEREKDSYCRLFEAGADRFLIRHETADRELYHEMHPDMSYDNRLRCLCDLKDIGYQNGSGFIVGLPGQIDEILASDLSLLKKLHPHMIGLGPFIQHKSTPLAGYPNGSVEKTRICMAIARLLVPDALIPVTTALAVLRPQDGWEFGLKAGANVIMTNLTPWEYRQGYDIYEGKSKLNDEAKYSLDQIKANIRHAGLSVSMERGDHVSRM